LAAYPNPFRDRVGVLMRLPGPGDARLEIYDAQGRVVKRTWFSALTAGEHVLDWDGRDALGRRLPAGLYFARCRSASVEVTRKLMKLD
jgi:flagellar hook assembly protein FlgD